MTTSDIECIETDCGKKRFIESFSIFDDIYKILINCNIRKIKLLISAGDSNDDLEDYAIKSKCDSISDLLYNSIIEMKDDYAYDFPDLLIDLSF